MRLNKRLTLALDYFKTLVHGGVGWPEAIFHTGRRYDLTYAETVYVEAQFDKLYRS